MTEQEALNELVSIVNGDDQVEPETNEVAQEPQEQPTEQPVATEEPKKEELNIEDIKQAMAEALAAKEQQ
uniref:hypothetical protein n=1 Tax=Campylobacter concisus TaxID=199 RepID=UPI001CA54A68